MTSLMKQTLKLEIYHQTEGVMIADTSFVIDAKKVSVANQLEDFNVVKPPGVNSELWKNDSSLATQDREVEFRQEYHSQMEGADGIIQLGSGRQVSYSRGHSGNVETASGTFGAYLPRQQQIVPTFLTEDGRRFSCSPHTFGKKGDFNVWVLHISTGWPVLADDIRLNNDVTSVGGKVFTIPHFLLLLAKQGKIEATEAYDKYLKLGENYFKTPYPKPEVFSQAIDRLTEIKRKLFVC